MNSRDYWAKREADQLKHYAKDEKEYDRQLQQIYKNMLDNCQKEIDSFYGRYAAKEGISIAEAKKRVSKLDIAAYERKAKRYVKDKDFSPKANEEMRLYNATMKINRLEMLKANIGLELIAGHDELDKFMAGILKGRTMEELERQAGILGKTVRNNALRANAIVNASFHNAKFSDRVWMYQDMMKADLSNLLQSGLIQGKNPRVLARELKKKFDVTTSNAERLMRTELARVQTEAQKQSFLRNGFTMYEFIVNGGCCPICAGLSGKHFKVDKMMPGENAPPMHPYCRCSTAAWEDSEEYEAWLDFLDKGGTTEEWNKQKAVDNSKKRSTIKSLDLDDFGLFAEINDILPEVSDVIGNTIAEFERKGGMYIAEAHFGDFYDEATGKPALFQIFVNAYGLTELNVNSRLLGGKTIEEANAMMAGTKVNLPKTLQEAIVHECGHAKAYYGKTVKQIEAMNDAILNRGVDGISVIAASDGAECIAEVEVLLYRGEDVPEEAMALYNEYVKGDKK